MRFASTLVPHPNLMVPQNRLASTPGHAPRKRLLFPCALKEQGEHSAVLLSSAIMSSSIR